MESELKLVSEEYKYGGTTDILIRYKGKVYIGDFKTSNHIYVEHIAQLAAYRHAVEETTDYKIEGAEELLRRDTEEYILEQAPLGVLSIAVYSSKPQQEAVQIDVKAKDGETINVTDIQQAITDYMNTLKPGETLYTNVLSGIIVEYGAIPVTITTPATDTVTVDPVNFIRPGVITITEV